MVIGERRRLWLTADGTIRPFDGDLDDYAKLVIDRAKADRKADKANAAPLDAAPRALTGKDARKAAADARAAVAHLKKAVETVEKRMAALTAEMRTIEQKLADPGLSTFWDRTIGR